MKSFKRKISKAASKKIKAIRPTESDLNKIVKQIDTGKINIPTLKGAPKASKIEAAKKIAAQNSKNQELDTTKLLPISNPEDTGVLLNRESMPRGEYDVLERFESNSSAARLLGRKFGAENDYVEAHIYDTKGQLLVSINEF